MNWEAAVLNRIYKTSDFKISNESLNKIKNKSKYAQEVLNNIQKYKLYEKGFRVNTNGAIYKLKENGNTKYFGYITNHTFNLFSNCFDKEDRFLDYSSLDFEGTINSEIKVIPGKVYTDCLKYYIMELLFIGEVNREEYNQRLVGLNKYLEFRTFIVGNEISPYDVFILCVLHMEDQWKNREVVYKEFPNIRRWYSYLINALDIK
jgi:hypothetical protein